MRSRRTTCRPCRSSRRPLTRTATPATPTRPASRTGWCSWSTRSCSPRPGTTPRSNGWYDHVNGPIASPSATSVDALAGPGNCGKPLPGANPARCGHGPRLPLLLISPWAFPNYVDHTLTNQASIIRFIEAHWRLGGIDDSDAANGQASFERTAGTLMNLFNFDARPALETVLLNAPSLGTDFLSMTGWAGR